MDHKKAIMDYMKEKHLSGNLVDTELATKSDTDILKDKCNTAIKCIFLVFLANVFLIISLWFK